MTRETKIGLVVASSFLCLVGVVVASKFNQSKTQAEDAALKVKKDLPSEVPQPIPLVSGAPGIFDPKVEKVASTLPNQGTTLPSIPGIPNETPTPSFPRIEAPPGFPEVKPSAPVSFPPAIEVKPQTPVSLPPVAEIKPPVESPGLPFTSVEDDKLKKAMEQLKNESTKPRPDLGGALAQADPVPPPVSPPPTSTPPIPAVPGTPPTPPSPGSGSLPTTPTLPSTPPVIPTPPGSTPTTPTLPSPVIPSIPPAPPGGTSTPTTPTLPSPVIPTPPGGTSTPPTLPGNPLAPMTPATPTLPTPMIPSSPTAPVFTPPQDLSKPPVENPLTRSPQDPTLPSPFAKPDIKPVTPPPPVDNTPRGSSSPVISELPSDKRPPFVGTLADPNKTAPIITSQPDTQKATGTQDIWQFQDSWEKVSTRFYQTPRYAKALEAFDKQYNNNRIDVRPGDTIYAPSAGYLDQRFAQFVSNAAQPIIQPGISPVAPPMGISPVAPPMGISPITPPPGAASNPGVDLTAPRSPFPTGAGTTSSYRVPSGGKFITEVARETLRSEFEWSRIFELNRHLLLNPSQRIPEGTILTIPQPKS